MKEKKNSIEQAVARKQPDGQAAPAAQGKDDFQPIVEELFEYMQSGEAPEGFDLEEACKDASFLPLMRKYGAAAAVRIWVAEKRADEAGTTARAQLDEHMQQRRGLPRQSAGGGYAASKTDYAGMDSAAFRKLSEQFRRSAREGKRVSL